MATKKTKKYFVSVLGIPFDVIIKEKVLVDREEVGGVTYGPKRLIELSKEENHTEELMNSTLIHEYCHAVLYVAGQTHTLTDEQEEGIVGAMEHSFSQHFNMVLEEYE